MQAVGLAGSLTIASACGHPEEGRILPCLTRVDGVDVAVLESMPMPFSEDLEWHFVARREVVSPDPSSPRMYDPSQVLPLSDGTLFVFDGSAPSPLAVLDPRLERPLRRFGHLGRGPGEIGGRVALGESDRALLVVDGINRQVHRFALGGEWLGSESLDVDGWPSNAGSAPDGSGFLLQLMVRDGDSWWDELLLVGEDDASARSFASLPRPSRDAEPGHIQKGRTLWTKVGPQVVAMWSDRPSIDVYGAGGALTRRIELPFTRRVLTDADVARERARVGAMAASLRPGSAALTNMLYPVNDTVFGMLTSALWGAAEDPVIPEDVIYWRLFTVRGEYIGFVRQPEDFRFVGSGSGTMWARLLDERFEPMLVELSIEPGSGPLERRLVH